MHNCHCVPILLVSCFGFLCQFFIFQSSSSSVRVCFSLPKEEPPSTCFPQLPVCRYMTPGRSYTSDQVVAPSCSGLGQPRCLLCSRGVHSVTLVVHLLSFLLAKCSRPSAFAFSYAPDNVCHTTLVSESSVCSFCSRG